MSATTHPRMTADEFVAWATRQPEGARYELEDGEIVAMAPERLHHALTKALIFQRLRLAIAASSAPCMAIPDGVGARVDAVTFYQPDAMVRCPATSENLTEVRDPLVVVEVASPSTANRDAGPKFVDYFRIASLRHYLLVIPSKRLVVHHARVAGAELTSRIIGDGAVPLDPPGIVLDGFWPEELGA